jgi:hypothetical protein
MMTMKRNVILACVLLVIPFIASLHSADGPLSTETILLARIRRHAAEQVHRIPNCLCREHITRWGSGLKGPFIRIDRLDYEVAYIEGRELFAEPGESFASAVLPRTTRYGPMASGAFALYITNLFVKRSPDFQYSGRERVGGRSVVRYDFRVPSMTSFLIFVEPWAKRLVVGLHGSFWADITTLDLFKLELNADDIPIEIGALSTAMVVDYRRVRVGKAEYLLPQRFQMDSQGFDSRRARMRGDFDRCREYRGDATITFPVQ